MDSPPLILRITDSFTRRAATLKLEEADRQFDLSQLLEKYLHRLPAEDLLESGSISSQSLRSLFAIQDLVFSCDDVGQLKGIFSGVVFRQDGEPLALEELPNARPANLVGATADLVEITVDRTNAGYDRNWAGFHRRRWERDAACFTNFVQETLEAALGQAGARRVLALDDPHSRLTFLETLARRIWEAPFENYSRFTGEQLLSKAGDETVRSIGEGHGGICTEKVQALKFLTDHYGFEAEYLIGGDGASGPVPLDRLREMLLTFDFRFGRRYMRYWQHAALLYHLDGAHVLVDATNGNIPFLFLKGEQTEALLRDKDKEFVQVRMVEAEENYYYHRVPQDIPLDLFFALEGWITDADMVQVFENELGLFLSRDFYVAPLPFRGEAEFERLAGEYQAIARRAGYGCQVSRDWTLDTELGREFARNEPVAAAGILASRDYLLLRYNEWDIPGHDAGLVVMRLA